MDYISLLITIFAAIITIFGYFSGKKLKAMILTEKEMIKDKVADTITLLQKHVDIVTNDRKTYSDPTRNSITIRIEINIPYFYFE
jgi:hypothetical protein